MTRSRMPPLARPVAVSMLTLSIAGALGGLRAEQVAVTEPAAELEARYLANEGFFVSGAGRRVLVDALFRSASGYPTVPADLLRRLERGEDEWGGVDVALATHYHADHFDADSVGAFLRANPEAVFVSTPQAVDELTGLLGDEPGLLRRARGVLPEPGAIEHLLIHGIRIDVLNLHHGRRDPPVENLGFVVTLGDRRFLHFGDTEAKMEDFEPYLELLAGVDLGILPFWFLSSEWRAELVRERIRPRWVVVAHLPMATAPSGHFGRWRSHGELVGTIESAFPEALFPESAGQSFAFTATASPALADP